MNKTFKLTTLVSLLSVPVSGLAEQKQVKIVYGQDNRVEVYEATELEKRLAASTAGMIKNEKVVAVGKTHSMLPPYSIEEDMGLCKDERFSKQPSAVICSGFLVGPDLLVTAGHCIENQESCDSVSWVFDYKVKESTKKADVLVSNSKIYKCSKVLDAKLEGRGYGSRDYALIKLDRVVQGVPSLKVRTENKIDDATRLVVIGHPSGLPTKVAPGAKVMENIAPGYFETNLDTFGGNSGAAVFDSDTGTVEGILVRGAKDYVADRRDGCYRVNQVENEFEAGRPDRGEAVSRITDIPTLKNRDAFLAAAKRGDLETVKKLAAEINYLEIYDDQFNNALHYAIKHGHNEVVYFLITKGINLNMQNAKGETPLHLAAYVNNKTGLRKLIGAGADVLIKDNYGFFASERTNYLAFGVRKLLRKAQFNEKMKRRNRR